MKKEKLIDLCTFIGGLWTGKKPPYVNIGVLRNTNFLKDGTLRFEDIAQLDVEEKQFKTRNLSYGDIILEKSGGGPKQPVGRVAVFDKTEGAYSFSNFTSALRIKNPNELNFYYLHYYLHNLYISGFTENLQTNSTGIRNLQMDMYKDIEVPIPPISIQLSIVKKINNINVELDNAIDATDAKLSELRLLKKVALKNQFIF
jgi:type I restriction enzyme S subunit